MGRTMVMLAACAFAAAGLAVWAFGSTGDRGPWEWVSVTAALLLVGLAAASAGRRLREQRSGEPDEDELSRAVMRKASSLAYYLSLCAWFALELFSGRLGLDAESLIGVGIAAMALAFFVSWLWAKVLAVHSG